MLIKLTTNSGSPIYFNPHSIHAIWKDEDGPTTSIHAGNKLFGVKEMPETIFALISEALSDDIDVFYDQ